MKDLDLDTLRGLATLAGFSWSDAELTALKPAVERALQALEQLEQPSLAGGEPTTQYRVL